MSFNKIFRRLKKSNASELFLFSKATMPEKYLDKSFALNSLKLLLLENTGSGRDNNRII